MKTLQAAACLALACTVACGGSGRGASTLPGGTLAYVMNECTYDLTSLTADLRQTLYVRRADRKVADPIRSLEVQVPPCRCGELPAGAFDCLTWGLTAFGQGLVPLGAFQRLGVSPDGRTVVFEVRDAPGLGAGEGTGIFSAPTDRSYPPRRIGPPSREKAWRFSGGRVDDDVKGKLCVDACPEFPLSPDIVSVSLPFFRFSPDGTRVVYTDRPDGDERIQVMSLDLGRESGEALRLSRLEALAPAFDYYPAVASPSFVDDRSVAFVTAVAGESGPVATIYRVAADGSGATETQPAPVPIPGSVVVPTFTITGASTVFSAFVPGRPQNVPCDLPVSALDLFWSDGENVLQLTNYRRSDTGTEEGMLAPILFEGHVYFTASIPGALNPTRDCQLFRTPALGGPLEQLTRFRDPSVPVAELDDCFDVNDNACDDSCCGQFGGSCCEEEHGAGSPICDPCGRDPACQKKCRCKEKLGCLVGVHGCHAQLFAIDRRQRKLILHTSCDPLCDPQRESCGRRGQIYSVGIDTGEIEQLVEAKGFGPTVELPGPYAYGGS